jgi:hypothetical protein
MPALYVGERGTAAATSANPATLSVSSSAQPGNTLILTVGCRDARNLPSGITITDSRSNTWNADIEEQDNSLNNYAGIFSTRQDGAALQAGDALTMNFGTSPTGPVCFMIEEFRGLWTGQALDQTGKAIDDVTTNGATVTCAGPISQAEELGIVAFFVNGGTGVVTRDPTWTDFTTPEVLDSTNGKTLDAQYKYITTAGTPSATYSWSSQAAARVIATYRSVMAFYPNRMPLGV